MYTFRQQRTLHVDLQSAIKDAKTGVIVSVHSLPLLRRTQSCDEISDDVQ